MIYHNRTINIRIYTKDNKVHEYRDVIEYVQGHKFFYVCLDESVATHPSELIKAVHRFDEKSGRDWQIQLKKRFSKNKDHDTFSKAVRKLPEGSG